MNKELISGLSITAGINDGSPFYLIKANLRLEVMRFVSFSGAHCMRMEGTANTVDRVDLCTYCGRLWADSEKYLVLKK